MSHRISKLVAVAGVSAALAIGGAGVAQAAGSPDHSAQKRDHACKNLQGKRKRECEKHHGKRHDKRHGKDRGKDRGSSRR